MAFQRPEDAFPQPELQTDEARVFAPSSSEQSPLSAPGPPTAMDITEGDEPRGVSPGRKLTSSAEADARVR